MSSYVAVLQGKDSEDRAHKIIESRCLPVVHLQKNATLRELLIGQSNMQNRIGAIRDIALCGSGSAVDTVDAALCTRGLNVVRYSDSTSLEIGNPAKLDGLILVGNGATDIANEINRIVGRLDGAGPKRRVPFDITVLTQQLDTKAVESACAQIKHSMPISLRALSIPSRAARLLLCRHPLHMGADVAFGQAPSLLIMGFGVLGQAIAAHAMRLAQYGLGKLVITVVDSDAQKSQALFAKMFSQAGNVATLHFRNRCDQLVVGTRPYAAVYICEVSDSESVKSAAQICDVLRCEQRSSPPVFVNLAAYDGTASVGEWDGQIYPYSALFDVCDPEVLFGFQGDGLAGIIHDYYRDSIAAQGRPLESTPAGEAWESLDESYRQACRHQADHVSAKLANIDCRAVPEVESDFFAFTSREVEVLSIIEHDRWSADRYLDGWCYGPERDNAEKIHPELIPYANLTDDMKDLDRYAVRLVPALLGRQGQSVIRDLNVACMVNSLGAVTAVDSKSQLHSIFTRLLERFPDRSLVLSVDLANELQRLVARYAMQHFPLRLRSILSQPVQDILSGFESNDVRCDFLDLLSRSERRYQLYSDQEMLQWTLARADVLLVIADNPAEYFRVNTAALPDHSEPRRKAQASVRRVLLNSTSGHTEWSFEY